MAEILREASELGLQPGFFPRFLRFEGRLFVRSEIRRYEGEIIEVTYTDDCTPEQKLIVFND